jgi:hypothetical protein
MRFSLWQRPGSGKQKGRTAVQDVKSFGSSAVFVSKTRCFPHLPRGGFGFIETKNPV